jgi:hypothetical protein
MITSDEIQDLNDRDIADLLAFFAVIGGLLGERLGCLDAAEACERVGRELRTLAGRAAA